MEKSVFHVAPNDGEWTVDHEKLGRAKLIFTSKQEALERVIDMTEEEQAKVLIHNDDGSVKDIKLPVEVK
jgi:hypothetical protein